MVELLFDQPMINGGIVVKNNIFAITVCLVMLVVQRLQISDLRRQFTKKKKIHHKLFSHAVSNMYAFLYSVEHKRYFGEKNPIQLKSVGSNDFHYMGINSCNILQNNLFCVSKNKGSH